MNKLSINKAIIGAVAAVIGTPATTGPLVRNKPSFDSSKLTRHDIEAIEAAKEKRLRKTAAKEAQRARQK